MEFTLEQLPEVARLVLEKASEKISAEHATLITFSGDLGAGKTTLIQKIAKSLGVKENLQSPTFVIYKRYEIPHSGKTKNSDSVESNVVMWSSLIHGDMYRLETGDEIKKLGWDQLLADSKNIICVEWPEKVSDVIPEWALKVTLQHKGGEEKREIDIS